MNVVIIIRAMPPKLFLSLLTFSLLTLSVAARPYVLVLSQEDFKDEVPADSDSSSAEWDEFGDSDSHKSEEDLDPGSWRQIFEPSTTDPQSQSDTDALYYSAVAKLMTGDARIIEEGSGEIETAAESGHPAAQSVLGFLWGIGLFRERNKQKAFVYHHFASEGGNMQSKMALAYLYTRQDMFDKSVKLYAELAEVAVNSFLISKDSPVIEPVRLHNGAEENKEALRKSKGEEDEDFQILEYQAQKGNAAAMYKVGLFYYFGLRGLRRDHSKALSWFLKAVDKGEPRSMELLGEIYARGAGVERNYTKAFEWLTLASKHHLYSAYNGIGYLYVKGYGVDSKNYTKAKEYFEKAADNEEVGGHYNLGVLYLKGIGVKRDVKLACKFFIVAANHGQPKAFYQLAKIFHLGVGFKKNVPLATALYKLVAERGPWSSLSRWALEAYLKGDVGKAYMLYSRMAEMGYEVAQSNAAWILDKYGERSMCMGESGFCTDAERHQRMRGYSEHRSDIEESGVEEASLVGVKDDRSEDDHGLLYDSALDDVNLQDIQHENEVKGDVERELHSFDLGKGKEVHDGNLTSEVVSSDDEAIEKQYVMVQKEDDDDIFEIENGKARGGGFDSFKEGDADCSPSSSWKRVENNTDEDDSEDSGSDRAESSSPDASMADIIPMLDELHPLLDVDAPQPAHLSRDGSDAASEKSQKSDTDDDDDDNSVESDEDIENHGEAEEDGVDEEEEAMEGGQEDESKSAIKWTEDDQKNLMDLGTLELERNRRLESLIARRMARRLMTEKNLIDLDCADVPSNVAPISVRRNPFDFPDESYAGMGLPPIPGSAPSILQPRRNPFDIPYDPNEEKPDLKRDSFQQEFTQFNQKDAFFRRHESFSMGPSVLGISKQERHDINWKPVFVSERMVSEGTSYFQRQSSEVSDSKLSEVSDSKLSSVPDTESASSGDQDERKLSERDLSPETELTSNLDGVSVEAGHGSGSSEENESVEMIEGEESNVYRDEDEIVLGGVEDPSEMEFYPATGELEIDEQFNDGETDLTREPSVDVSSSRSSQSYRSEVIDDIPDEESEKTANLQHEDGHFPESRTSTQTSVEESIISTRTSVEESNFQHISGEVEETPLVPVYDCSPPSAEQLISFSSLSSDSATEFSETALPTVSVDTTADVADKEYKPNDKLEDNSSNHEKIQAASSELHAEVKNEMRSEESEDIDQYNVTAEELSAVIPSFVDQNRPARAEFSVDSNFSLDIGSEKGVTDSGLFHEQDIDNHISADSEMLHQDNVESPDSNYHLASDKLHMLDNESVEEDALPNEVSKLDNENMSVSVQDEDEMPDSVASDSHHIPSNSSSMHALGDSQFLPVETEHLEKNWSNEERIFPIEQDKVLLSSSREQGNTIIHQDLDKNHLSSSDKLVDAQSSSDHDESQNSDNILVEPSQDAGTSNDGVGELHEHDSLYETPVMISSVTSENSDTPEFRSPTGEVDLEVYKHHGELANEDQNEAQQNLVPSAEGYMSPNNEENFNEFDYMKDIDEEFLSELDTVGDFSVGDAGVSHRTDVVHEETRDAQLSSLPEDVKTAEVEQDNDIPVLEVRSLEDIDIAFKQLQEGVDVNDVILPSTIKDQLVSDESRDHVEVNSDLPVIEARSLEDIDVALEKISEDNQGELPEKRDAEDASVKLEANEDGSAKLNESFDVSTGAEETSRTPVGKLENVSISGSSNKEKSHSRKSSSSSSSSSSDSD